MKKTDSIDEGSYAEKVRIFSNDYLKCCIYISGVDRLEVAFTQTKIGIFIGS
jgi:hypothetical protein